MDAVLRATAIYFFLILIFRLGGKRTFSEITPFDFILLLIIAETTQQGLLGNDFSITNTILLVTALFTIDIIFSHLKAWFPRLEKVADGLPLILIDDGEMLRDCMKSARVDEADILYAARNAHGLERLEQIKYAILERSGGISIIPKSSDKI